MMFFDVMSSSTLCFGYSRACSSISGLMRAAATVKAALARSRPASTFWRSSRFRRTISRNCFISSSLLSLRSLWPRVAVFSRPFSRVSSILVGFMVAEGIASPLFYSTASHTCLGRYLSIISGLMRLSSLRGRMLRSSQPRSSVSSMDRFSSCPWVT